MATNTSGAHRLCCFSSQSKHFSGYAPSEYDQKINQKSFINILEGSYHREVRRQMDAGVRVSDCEICYRKEDQGIISKRIQENHIWKLNSEQSVGLKSIDIRLDRSCNLHCFMCSSEYSTKWDGLTQKMLKEAKSEKSKSYLAEKYEFSKTQNSPFDPNKILEFADSLEEVQFAGGEPLIQKGYKEILKILIDSGQSRNIVLKYNTNLTIIDEEIFLLWQKFKKIKILLSLDGVGKKNDFIRSPSRWNHIMKNVSSLFAGNLNVSISIILTVQALNVLDLYELHEWLTQSELNEVSLHYNLLNSPRFLAVKALPSHLKALASERVQKLLQLYEKKPNATQITSLQEILIALQAEPENACDWNSFKEYTKNYADSIEQDHVTIFKELFDER